MAAPVSAPVSDDLSRVKLEPEDADTELSRAIERSRRLRQEAEAQVSQSPTQRQREVLPAEAGGRGTGESIPDTEAKGGTAG